VGEAESRALRRAVFRPVISVCPLYHSKNWRKQEASERDSGAFCGNALRLDRVAAITLAKGTRPEEIVVDETTGRAFNDYRHEFAKVRARAALKVPSVAGKRDQDIRDTCVTMLFRAGCDALEICDITGHSYKSVQLIMKHYLGRDAQRADAAIDKLSGAMGARREGGVMDAEALLRELRAERAEWQALNRRLAALVGAKVSRVRLKKSHGKSHGG